MVSNVPKGVFNEVEELFVINMSVYQESLIIMKYLSLHPIGDEGANTFVRNPLEFLTIGRICKIRIQN
jgi:hypothetical protein